jgi:predicted Fe-Mo cluster-binding NifX family protein
MLDKDQSGEFSQAPAPWIQVAVATKSGMLVDQHFGQVSEFYIYEYNNGSISFKERRPVQKYCNGNEDCDTNENHMEEIIRTISDCRAVIAMRIGEAPKQKLGIKGIKVFTTCDIIEDSVKKVVAELY